jgi:hypothetical protein
MARQTVKQQMEQMFATVEEFTPKLLALMPPSARIQGDPDGEMHLSMTDWNSCEAARVTLEKFGHGVERFAVEDGGTQWFIRFADDAVGSAAITFYNRLPKNMSRYKPKA